MNASRSATQWAFIVCTVLRACVAVSADGVVARPPSIRLAAALAKRLAYSQLCIHNRRPPQLLHASEGAGLAAVSRARVPSPMHMLSLCVRRAVLLDLLLVSSDVKWNDGTSRTFSLAVTQSLLTQDAVKVPCA